MLVASWNLKGRSGGAAASLGSLLRDRGGADLVLLQEASPRGIGKFSDAAGLDWVLHIRDVAPEMLSARGRSGKKGGRGRPRSVALAGRGDPARCPVVFPDVPLPEKVMAASVDLDGVTTTVVTYHAPTGVQHKLKKPDQAVRLAQWLASVEGPVVLGGDFNTPKLDPPDQRDIRTHWHTGDTKLKGLPGDDLLVGPEPIHGRRSAWLSTWLSDVRQLARFLYEDHEPRCASKAFPNCSSVKAPESLRAMRSRIPSTTDTPPWGSPLSKIHLRFG